MIQHHQPTPPGRFAVCSCCGSEPRHIVVHGRSMHESAGKALPFLCGPRHMLECRCGRATAYHDNLDAAEAEWGYLDSQVPLALPPAAAVAHIHAQRGKRKAVRK